MPTDTPEILKSYEVVAKLREGGMGAIYRVRHRLLDQERVIKILRPQIAGEADFRARFLREAQLVARLRHPNLAVLHEFALADTGAGCIVMEFIDGLSVKDMLETSGPPSLGLALEIARQGLEALGYLHRGGILHRDISTDNLMLTRDHDGAPLVKVIDLGIAKRIGEGAPTQLTATGAFLGKVRYASPEQFRGDLSTLDARSDLYSFGVVLYELLTGAFPIAGEDANSLIAGHLFQPPRPFAETDPDGRLPEALRGVVLRAIAKDREARFQTASEFAAALEPVAARFSWDRAELDRILAQAPPVAAADGDGLSAALSAAVSAGGSTMRLAPTVVTAASPAEPTVLLPEGQTRRRRRASLWVVLALVGAAGLALVARTVLRSAAVTSDAPERPAADPGEAASAADAIVRGALARGHAYALVIGNGTYPQLPALPSAVGDAAAVADLLESGYGFTVERLTDATRAEILGALESYERRLGEDDRLLVYYAGHGGLELLPGQDGGEPKSIGYWLPVDAPAADDANVIYNSDVASSLQGMKARQILVIADSCYAGTIALERLATSPAGADREGELTRLVESRARLALSSGGNEPVPERSGGRSVFAEALVGVLSQNRGVLRSADLFARVDRLVEDASLRRTGAAQTPTLGVIPGTHDDGGEFFFARAAAAEKAAP